MTKTISVEVTDLIRFPETKFSHTDLVRNLLPNRVTELISKISEVKVQSEELTISALSQYVNHTDSDIRAMTYAGIGGAHTFTGNYIKAFASFRRALGLANTNDATAFVYLEFANLLRILKYSVESIALINEARRITSNPGLILRSEMLRALNIISSDPEEALRLFKNVHESYLKNNDTVNVIRTTRHIARSQLAKHEYDQALQLYKKCLSFTEEYSLAVLQYDILNDIGWLFFSRGDNKEAASYFNQIIEAGRSPYQESLALQNLGHMEFEQEHYDQAIDYHSRSLQLTRKYEMRNMAFEDYCKLGLAHEKTGQLPLADRYFASGYADLKDEIDLGLRIIGWRKTLLNKYIEFLDRYKSMPNIDLQAAVFKFSMDKTLDEIRRIFHTNLFNLHLQQKKNADELCHHLGIDTRTYFLYQKKLGLKRGPGEPELINNDPYFNRYLDEISELDWRTANRKFEADLFSHLLKANKFNKKELAGALGVSYQQVLLKTKDLN